MRPEPASYVARLPAERDRRDPASAGVENRLDAAFLVRDEHGARPVVGEPSG
jgi:hypothetical protein